MLGNLQERASQMTARSLLALNMKRLRELRGYTQMDLAERVGCSTTLIGNIEIRKRFPSPENLDLIATALEVSPADLFVEAGSSAQPESLIKSKLERKIHDAIDEAFAAKHVK
jgi:transcriptional regulator with XRE-family HTH domain